MFWNSGGKQSQKHQGLVLGDIKPCEEFRGVVILIFLSHDVAVVVFKHDVTVNGRRQTAKITSDFEFFSSNP